jgi:hypothetical protein
MLNHRMVECLQLCKEQATSYPAPSKVQAKMQRINSQVVEMQQGSEQQCWQIFMGSIAFSEPVQTIYMRRCVYQESAKGTDYTVQRSNIIHDALKAGIPMPWLLKKQQCLDGVEVCSRKLSTLRGQGGGLRQVHLWDCLILVKSSGDEDKCKGVHQTILREEQTSIWQQINRAINEPSLGAVPFVQRMEHGEVVNIYEAKAMNLEIQVTTEQRFDLSMSTPITLTSLWDRLRFNQTWSLPRKCFVEKYIFPWTSMPPPLLFWRKLYVSSTHSTKATERLHWGINRKMQMPPRMLRPWTSGIT